MNVGVSVIGQRLSFNSNAMKIVSGSKNFVRFVFSFTADWDSLSTYAQFIQDGSSYIVEVGDDKACYLPDVIVDGECTLSLRGIGGAGGSVIATTNPLTFNVTKSNYREDGSEEIIEDVIATVEEVQAYITE